MTGADSVVSEGLDWEVEELDSGVEELDSSVDEPLSDLVAEELDSPEELELDSGAAVSASGELDCAPAPSAAVPVEPASVEVVVGVAVGARSFEDPLEALEPEVLEPFECRVG